MNDEWSASGGSIDPTKAEWIRILLFLFRQDQQDDQKIFSPSAWGLSAEGRIILTILLILSN